MNHYDSGLRGEARAEVYLTGLGMQVLARRYRAEGGELDLVMLDGEVIVFVEVKARLVGRPGDGLKAITPAKQRRMTHAAQAFLIEREYLDRPVRFDAVEITGSGILHIPNAFQAAR